jgi:hypothetical protein
MTCRATTAGWTRCRPPSSISRAAEARRVARAPGASASRARHAEGLVGLPLQPRGNPGRRAACVAPVRGAHRPARGAAEPS